MVEAVVVHLEEVAVAEEAMIEVAVVALEEEEAEEEMHLLKQKLPIKEPLSHSKERALNYEVQEKININ